MRWPCLAIRPPRGFAVAPMPPPAGGCFSIPARISAAAGAPWKPAASPTRCGAIARVDERLLVLGVAGFRLFIATRATACEKSAGNSKRKKRFRQDREIVERQRAVNNKAEGTVSAASCQAILTVRQHRIARAL